ncbi:FimV/HubP family polar landmark protein [Vibrio sp. TBV020]|uniref:FimV/HubP family polar landmark protein n=1 Tax=Vibrio sp. TBV020 TaxID=3137398 RepID=UPI0038CDBC10
MRLQHLILDIPEPVAEEPSLEIDDLELPEYSEEDALADAIAAPELDIPEPVAEEPSLEIDDLELPEYREEDALADATAAPELEIPEPVAEEPSLEIDDLELPEFSEEDALADSELELELPDPVTEEASLEIGDLDLPEYGEEDALMDLEPLSEELPAESDDFELDQVELPELGEIPAENTLPQSDELEMQRQEFNESTFNELLSEDDTQSTNFSFDAPIDETTSDSAGMDIDAMLEIGEDWNGFSLSADQQAEISDDIPEDEQDVWSQDNQPEQAQILDENWEDQPDLDEFNPQANKYRTIDELMAEVESEEAQEIDEELKLDVGLNDFPDVIGDIGAGADVDANSEAAGKLDLAKIYLEMNDSQGARKLLEEAIVDGSDEIRREAKNLIDVINKS